MIVDFYNFFLKGSKGQIGIYGAPGPEVRITAYLFEFISPNNFWTKIESPDMWPVSQGIEGPPAEKGEKGIIGLPGYRVRLFTGFHINWSTTNQHHNPAEHNTSNQQIRLQTI